MNETSPVSSVEIRGPGVAREEEVLTPGALDFVAMLVRKFGPRRNELLQRRRVVQWRLDDGEDPSFLPETSAIRERVWHVAPPPWDLLDRRVEITGPVERKMIINALNSGASVYMADFEDSMCPTWENVVAGQVHLRDAVRGVIDFVSPENGKEYRLNERIATLMVRPRGWHLVDEHVRVDGEPAPASLVDFGLFFFHNAAALVAKGTGPYFYLPKLESHLEARLWNDVFLAAQRVSGLPSGTIRATVLIETILAAFEMDEILFELREHSAGLNCGRWDYIFSFIKKFSKRGTRVLPDRSRVTMDRLFLKSYVDLLIRTCHRRGIHAMGGMAAQIPVKDDAEANRRALASVAADKSREVRAGHDGTWVAHPGLVPVAREIFDREMPEANQIARCESRVPVAASDLLAVPGGPITEAGLARNIEVAILYLSSWMRGIGCVPIGGLMEDAATAEICRAQIWQWLRHGAKLVDGRVVTPALYESVRRRVVQSPVVGAEQRRNGDGTVERAIALFDRLVTAVEFPEFLTQPAYAELLEQETKTEEEAHVA